MASIKDARMSLLCVVSGIVYFIVGMMQQFMVNYPKWTAVVGLIASLIFAIFALPKREGGMRIGFRRGELGNLVLLVAFCLVAAMNLVGCFVDTFATLSTLGITSFVMGGDSRSRLHRRVPR